MPHTYADGNDPTGIDFLKELVLASVNTMIFSLTQNGLQSTPEQLHYTYRHAELAVLF